jgi:AmiR/NasT family two-component response regulator
MSALETGADDLEQCQEELGNLREKMVSLPSIEQAKGILISEEGYSDDEAFDVLKTASMRENRKLRDIAVDLVGGARRRARERRRPLH